MLREITREGKGRGGATKCQDCGNQAKKGCEFIRCRTCCNNKGFRCQTHISSTWVRTSRRRPLHQPQPQTLAQNNNPSPGLEELNKLPAVMSSTAVFRCVRVRSEDDTVDEYAYQTSVNVGGRVFSGVLYDQGPGSFYYNNVVGQSSKGPLNLIHNHPQNQHDHFVGSSMMQSHDDAPTVRPPLIMPPSSADHFSSSSYPLSLGTFRPAISYFPQPKTS
ncbi:protein SHI RELATED SEQUENCE 3-like [Neltuma alba]|uniref:protein SHI RELATED SEQUENCE 3-like n=1 Tax=Neltuma alba TaxID=207710 RepID=UPI0010A3DFDE|nr:protein SHI RELATED SEQUENCE 3-like [Prosopis alba]